MRSRSRPSDRMSLLLSPSFPQHLNLFHPDHTVISTYHFKHILMGVVFEYYADSFRESLWRQMLFFALFPATFTISPTKMDICTYSLEFKLPRMK